QGAVLVDRGHFHQRDVDVAEEAEPGVLGDVAEVDVDVFEPAGVDPAAHLRVRLVGHAQLHAVDLGQGAVELGCGGGAGQHLHAEGIAGGVGPFHAFGQRLRHRLRVAVAGEAAHGHGVAGADVGGGLGGGGQLP